MHLNKDTLDHKAPNPELLAKAHSLMEWRNVLVIACSALGITAWFTSHVTMFYVLGSIALILSLLFMWGPVFIGLPHSGKTPPLKSPFSFCG